MSLSSHQAYRHSPLPDGRYIRLIRVHAAANPAKDLVCDLDDADLDSGPEYEALSYAWEGQSRSLPILCSTGSYQGSLLITPNCAAALRQLRHESEQYTIWIDSICIDQTSINERSSQVALMGAIYKAAKRIVIWLGDKDEHIAAAMELIGRISSQTVSPENPAGEDARLTRKEIYSRARELTKDMASEADDIFHPLFQRSWFTRMWTVQEIVLNPFGILNCGGITLPWADVILAADVLDKIGYKYGGWQKVLALQKYLTVALAIKTYPQARDIINRNNLRDDIADIDIDFDVFRTFHYGREKEASDPKDKIYALHGILTEFGVNLPAPDYRKTLEEIYTEATLTLMEHDQSLVVLHFATSANRRKGLPSWVPDFTDQPFDEQDPRFPVTRSRFGAGGSMEAQWESRLTSLQLLMRGKMIDRVMYRGQGLPSIDPREVKLKELLRLDDSGQLVATESLRNLHKSIQVFQEWCDVAQWSDSYPNGQTTKDALRTALLNDFPRSMNDYTRNAAFEPWLQYMSKVAEDSSQGASTQIATEFDLVTALFTGPGFPFYTLAMPFCANKTLYRTEKGWLGTAPDFTPDPIQAGDMIATIRGMEMPVVLRPSDATGGYRLISHCYVHGWMYGEGWDDGSEYRETGILLV